MKKKRLIPWLLCFLLVFATSSLVFLDQAQAAPTQTAGKAENYTGWKTISGQKYYYRNGKALKGLKKVGKYYYFFGRDGIMRTGWQRISNQYRYFGKRNGTMCVNKTIGGRRINSKGVWTPVIVLDPGHSGVVAGGSVKH